jgi:predicted NUDIX family NTP pyrophosphohydrolase
MATKTSAGLMMFRFRDGQLEVFLAHPGGPFFARKDDGHWTIPKGVVEPGEDRLAAAVREFREEVGIEPRGSFLELGNIQQRSGKIVYGWAFEGDWDDRQPIQSSTFTMEWPPLSGQMQQVPEVDRAKFFSVTNAARKIKAAQRPFIDRLVSRLPRYRGLEVQSLPRAAACPVQASAEPAV